MYLFMNLHCLILSMPFIHCCAPPLRHHSLSYSVCSCFSFITSHVASWRRVISFVRSTHCVSLVPFVPCRHVISCVHWAHSVLLVAFDNAPSSYSHSTSLHPTHVLHITCPPFMPCMCARVCAKHKFICFHLRYGTLQDKTCWYGGVPCLQGHVLSELKWFWMKLYASHWHTQWVSKSSSKNQSTPVCIEFEATGRLAWRSSFAARTIATCTTQRADIPEEQHKCVFPTSPMQCFPQRS